MRIVICRHEAAHAVCSWYLGNEVYRVQVTTEACRALGIWPTDRSGKELHRAAGHTEYESKLVWYKSFRDANSRLVAIRNFGIKRLAAILAGPIMTALDTGESLNYAFRASGLDDRQNAYNIRSFCKINLVTTHKIIINTALFLCNPASARAVHELSLRLDGAGKVNKQQLDNICSHAFRHAICRSPIDESGMRRFINADACLALEINKHSIADRPRRRLRSP